MEARPLQSQLSLRAQYTIAIAAKCRKIKRREARTVSLHDTEELYNDLRGRANENLALSTTLSVDDAFLQD